MTELPEWRKRALQDPNLPAKQVEVLLHGPKCLTDAWLDGLETDHWGAMTPLFALY